MVKQPVRDRLRLQGDIVSTDKIIFELGFHFEGQYMTATVVSRPWASKGNEYEVLAVDWEDTAINMTPDIMLSIQDAFTRREERARG